jgi:cbb3-type cytochrome oxidase subunit 3
LRDAPRLRILGGVRAGTQKQVNIGYRMEHPVQYMAVVTKFLDRLIQEHGERLFVVFVYVCLGVIIWIFTRRRKHPVQDIRVVILPFNITPKKEPEHLPGPFDDRSGL